MKEMNSHVLRNSSGMQVTLLDFGARVISILFPVKEQLTEMILTYKNIDDFKNDPFYLGATVGRVCNRIAQARFSFLKHDYHLSKNSNEHCLHGGENGFSKRNWQFNQQSLSESYAELSLTSSDGDQGFPGRLSAKVSYRLTDDNCLKINFSATSEQDTLVNLCNHCYFHLGEESINNLSLKISADQYLPTNHSGIPTGETASVINGPFSFIEEKLVGETVTQSDHLQIKEHKGFDHCYVLESANHMPVAHLRGQSKAVELLIYTDQPGLQLYSGQYLEDKFSPYQALCMEAQGFPDAVNHSHFPNIKLKANETYSRYVNYQFLMNN